jgi:ribosomal protein S18 acetylase RimI-like enzyme
MAQVLISPYQMSDHEGVEKIFWQTSARTSFENPDKKKQFQTHYLDRYLQEIALVAKINSKVVGYIIATENSLKMPHSTDLFSDLYEDYPAHLHINCDENFRGQGIGRQLIDTLENKLKSQGCAALHLITSPSAQNVSFYRQLGFDFEVLRGEMLFLGKKLFVLNL